MHYKIQMELLVFFCDIRTRDGEQRIRAGHRVVFSVPPLDGVAMGVGGYKSQL